MNKFAEVLCKYTCMKFVELCEWQADLFSLVSVAIQTARHLVSRVNPPEYAPHETPFCGTALSVVPQILVDNGRHYLVDMRRTVNQKAWFSAVLLIYPQNNL